MEEEKNTKRIIIVSGVISTLIVGILIVIIAVFINLQNKDYSKIAAINSRNFVYGYMSAGNYDSYLSFLKIAKKISTDEVYSQVIKVPDRCSGSIEEGYKNSTVVNLGLTVTENFIYHSIDEYYDDYYSNNIEDEGDYYDMYSGNGNESDTDEVGSHVVSGAETLLGYMCNGTITIKFGGVTELKYDVLMLTDCKGMVSGFKFKLVR